jgi:hypothetical protein
MLTLAVTAFAQEPPPKIGPFVIDLHGTVPRFPREQPLADSRAVLLDELPGAGLGLHAGAHVYVLRIKPMTLGLGVDLTAARTHQGAPQLGDGLFGRAVTERFTHIAPEISFNFGTGDGWSYISGGIGPGVWSVEAEGGPDLDANHERLKTINYGGGARWFIKRHIAFSVDARFYAINPGTPQDPLPGGPRKTLLFMGAGLSVK